MKTQKIAIITGATASGKSALALLIAEEKAGVIINADSQQMFADLPILTARPTPADEARAPHKLYGILSANEQPSAGKWLRFAKMEIDWALSQGRLPIVCGGTGLYLKALMEGIAEIPDIEESVRAQAENDYDAMGKVAFEERLRIVDPEFFARLKVYDRQRLVRAYSVWLGSGKPLSYWQKQEAKPAYDPAMFELHKVELAREELYKRCDSRFVTMVKQGAVEEVKELSKICDLQSAPIGKVIGVNELSSYINGEIALDDAIARAQQMTRNYAKRQMTWIRHQLK